jgi:hypothetical protein
MTLPAHFSWTKDHPFPASLVCLSNLRPAPHSQLYRGNNGGAIAHIGRGTEGKEKGKGEGRGRERGEKGKEGGREGVGTEREQKGKGRGLQRAKRSQKEGGSTGDFRNSLAVVISSLSFTQVSIALTPPFHT